MTVVIAVVACTVLLVVVSLVLVVVIYTAVLYRRRGKKNTYEDADANKSVRLQATQNTLEPTASYQPIEDTPTSLDYTYI